MPFHQKKVEAGFFDYYVYEVQYPNDTFELVLESALAPTQTVYASQKYDEPRANRYEWKSHTVGSLIKIKLDGGNFKFGPVYFGVDNANTYDYKITAFMPAPSDYESGSAKSPDTVRKGKGKGKGRGVGKGTGEGSAKGGSFTRGFGAASSVPLQRMRVYKIVH